MKIDRFFGVKYHPLLRINLQNKKFQRPKSDLAEKFFRFFVRKFIDFSKLAIETTGNALKPEIEAGKYRVIEGDATVTMPPAPQGESGLRRPRCSAR